MGGSFYDFSLTRFHGTSSEQLVTPPDEWGGRAAAAWARRLAENRSFDAAAHECLAVAALIDRVYAAASRNPTA